MTGSHCCSLEKKDPIDPASSFARGHMIFFRCCSKIRPRIGELLLKGKSKKEQPPRKNLRGTKLLNRSFFAPAAKLLDALQGIALLSLGKKWVAKLLDTSFSGFPPIKLFGHANLDGTKTLLERGRLCPFKKKKKRRSQEPTKNPSQCDHPFRNFSRRDEGTERP